jgi:hypothetical protein
MVNEKFLSHHDSQHINHHYQYAFSYDARKNTCLATSEMYGTYSIVWRH